MSDKPKVLVIIGDGGEVDRVLSDPQADTMFLDMREISARNEWYARDTLVEAERWPAHWQIEFDTTIGRMVEIVETAGIEPPTWLLERRNERLLKSLADLQNL